MAKPDIELSLSGVQALKSVAITRPQAAAALGVDPRTVTAGIKSGAIPSVTVGRRVLIPRLPFLALFGAATGPAHD